MERRCSYSQHRPIRLPSAQGLSNICGSILSTVTKGKHNPVAGCLVNDIERMGKEQIVAQFEMLFWSVWRNRGTP